ncbi:MAG: glycosyltransferase [Candidatus Latescibacteria bacterium]|nr:glycosyltransferase [Candidatus Latescibacterota bacterium]
MKVLFLTQYGYLAASSRTRVFQYLPYLDSHQIGHRVITVLPDTGLAGSQIQVTRRVWQKLRYYMWAFYRTCYCGLQAGRLAPAYDIVFIQKIIFPAWVRWLLGRCRTPLVYDFDDAIFTTEVRQTNLLDRWKKKRNGAGLPAMLQRARHVLVENEYTAAYAARHCSRVSIITGPIDTQHYQPVQPSQAAGPTVTLGWIGSASTLPYLELIGPPLARLARRFPDMRLRVIGTQHFELAGVPVDARPWALEREVEELGRFDIGLMPIPDDPWTRGKGGYKLLQYMAMGLPVVTSPVGINQQIVQDRENGYWARTDAEWEECLSRLIQNRDLRLQMGRKGRATVEAEYALGPSSLRLKAILEKIGQETAHAS